jgi:mannose-1-phosphate guanylyltransferase
VRVHYAVEPEPLDTAGAIAFAAREAGVDDTFIVANGDIITDLDVARLVEAHRASGSEATIHLIPVADPSAFGVVETDATGAVLRFVEKPAPGETESNLINAGTYVLEPSVLELIEPGRRVSIERDTFPRLVDRGRLAAVATEDYWIDAGRPSLYLRANLDLATGRVGNGDEQAIAPRSTVDPSARCVDSVVGAGATVAAGASVTASVILTGATIGERATVVDSIIAGHVGADADVSGSVIGAGYDVPDGASLTDAVLPADNT